MTSHRKGLAGPYIRAYLWPFLAALACLTVESVCDLLQPTIMARIVDSGVAARDIGIVLRFGLAMLSVAAVGMAGATGRNIISSIVSYRFGARLRADLFQRITSYSFSELDSFDTASLITRQTNDVTQVQAFVNGVMRIFAKAPILAVGGLVMAILLEPGLSIVLAIAVPVSAALIAVNLVTGFPRFRRMQEGLDGVNSVTREYLGGIRVVKAFGQERREVRRFGGANRELTAASTFALRVMAFFGPAITLFMNLGIVAVLWIGGFRVVGKSLEVGKIIAFINYMTQILFSLNMISGIITSFVRAKASWERVGAVLATPASEVLDGTSVPVGASTSTPVGDGAPVQVSAEATVSAVAGATRRAAATPWTSAPPVASVRFNGVSFAYPASHGRLVLEGVDLDCAPGKVTAVIGPTGSGKSSLVSLVPRFYEPTEGAIFLGGTDIRQLDLRRLRQRIALVPQKTVLFTGTIAENLRWGRANASDAELQEAARMARAHDFISRFPEGYQSVLGQSGVNLSGGQKQRIAIARALVRRPEVLILDDCTSSVDAITEAEILAEIRRSAGQTCILITQRISAAAAADQILVLDDGKPSGLGRHETLVRECEVYRDMCIAQLGKEAVGVRPSEA
jgi:ATP-binding cassette subfamily B multidrug efflux pump